MIPDARHKDARHRDPRRASRHQQNIGKKASMDLLQKMWPALIVWGVMFAVWWVLRIRGRSFASAADFEEEIKDERIKVLEFFSNG